MIRTKRSGILWTINTEYSTGRRIRASEMAVGPAAVIYREVIGQELGPKMTVPLHRVDRIQWDELNQ